MNIKWSVIKLGGLAAVMALGSVAWANPGAGSGPNGEFRAARQAAKQAEREEKREARQAERDARVVDARRPNRLTPEERRDLRRQINQAGQDLYQDGPKK